MSSRRYGTWIGVGLALAAAVPSSSQVVITGTVTVSGGSTVRSWECAADTLRGSVALVPGATLATDGLGEAVRTLDVRVPVGWLDCRNGRMNDHMWDALEREAHPEIRYRMTGYTVTSTGPASATVELRGELTIAGTTRPHSVSASARALGEGGLRVRGDSPLDMTGFGVEPPRLMLGTLRVHDDVTVTFDLTLEPQDAAR